MIDSINHSPVSLKPLDLPPSGALGSYWLPDVGIGPHGSMKHVHVPLGDYLQFMNTDGTPQSNIVYLFSATFDLDSPTFLEVPTTIAGQLSAPAGGLSNVAKLRAKGIKVVLTVLGNSTIGWETIPPGKMAEIADEIRTFLDENGLDGIDIDDEYSPGGPGLVDMVANLRAAFDGTSLTISKALFNDEEFFTIPASSNGGKYAGAYLGQLLDMGSTMSYFAGLGILEVTAAYSEIVVSTPNGGRFNVGIPKDRLFMGVQAGTSQRTTCADSYTLAQESIKDGYRGMLVFTFSQDIQQFTHEPQNEIMWPDLAYDHQWHRAVVAGMQNPNSTKTGAEVCKQLTPPVPQTS